MRRFFICWRACAPVRLAVRRFLGGAVEGSVGGDFVTFELLENDGARALNVQRTALRSDVPYT